MAGSENLHNYLLIHTYTRVDYYTTHPPFNTSSSVAIAAVGTVAIGLQYTEVSVQQYRCVLTFFALDLRLGII